MKNYLMFATLLLSTGSFADVTGSAIFFDDSGNAVAVTNGQVVGVAKGFKPSKSVKLSPRAKGALDKDPIIMAVTQSGSGISTKPELLKGPTPRFERPMAGDPGRERNPEVGPPAPRDDSPKGPKFDPPPKEPKLPQPKCSGAGPCFPGIFRLGDQDQITHYDPRGESGLYKLKRGQLDRYVRAGGQ